MLLMIEPIPRYISYDRAWPQSHIDTLTDDQYWINFRFVKRDIVSLAALLELLAVVHASNGCICPHVDALCMVLRRFSYPNRLCEAFFGRPTSSLSLLINKTVHILWNNHRQRLTSFDMAWLQQNHLQQYADVIHEKGAPLVNCIGFIDGTVRPICRPTRYQRVCYNGHKRIHAIKFQSVVILNGLIARLYGPHGWEEARLCTSSLEQTGGGIPSQAADR